MDTLHIIIFLLLVIITFLTLYFFYHYRKIINTLKIKLIKVEKELGYFKYALDNSTIVGITDKEGTIIYANKKFSDISGYSIEELIGKNHRILNSGYHSKEFFKNLWDTIKSGNIWNGEIRNKTKSGQYYWVDATIIPQLDENNKPYQYIAIRHDITKRKDNEQKALEYSKNLEIKNKELMIAKDISLNSLKQKENFLANISHEIRTPVYIINEFSGMLSGTDLTDEQKEYLKAISLSTENLNVLINDIIDITKLRSGKFNILNKVVNIRELLNNVTETLKLRAKNKNLELSLIYDDKIPEYIISDPIRLNQVFNNLLINAIKFTDKGYITFTTRLIGQSEKKVIMEFSVEDTGIGIPEDKIGGIFDMFVQLFDDYTQYKGGAGLGLPIIKNIISKMNGSIDVESKFGKGTKFTIIIEFKMPEKTQEKQQQKEIDTGQLVKELGQIRILAAEDNVFIQKILANIFRKYDIEYTIVSNGKEVIDILDKKSFDLIIMDLQMPGIDGYKATESIRKQKDKPYSEIPIIASTARALKNEVEKAYKIGMDDYIIKPFRASELIEKIYNVKKGIKEAGYDKQIGKKEFINLDYLKELTMDDENFYNEIISDFKITVPKSLEELKNLIYTGKISEIKSFAHKLKSTFSTIEIEDASNILDRMELEIIDKEDFIRSFDELEQIIKTALKELK
ncbi:MAG: response regulator [Ignavibacteria bacterium]|nr:response regulator [Ignavibacteria bacterium]